MNILFVYNADSGALNLIFDIAHKVLSPATYQCSLCALTHNALNEKLEWAKFKQSSVHNLTFLHKDEFEAQFNVHYEYPVILETTGELKVLFSAAELNHFNSVKELISALEKIG